MICMPEVGCFRLFFLCGCSGMVMGASDAVDVALV